MIFAINQPFNFLNLQFHAIDQLILIICLLAILYNELDTKETLLIWTGYLLSMF